MMHVLETSSNKEIQNNIESSAEPLIAAQQGEPPEIIYFTAILLNNERTRTILYLVLILMWIFPLLLQSMNVVIKENYDSNSFCSTGDLCIVSFIGFCIVFIGAIIGFIVVFLAENRKYLHIMYTICFGIGFFMLSIIMIIISTDYGSNHEHPDTFCFDIPDLFKLDDANFKNNFCRISYFGNNFVGLMMVFTAILDKILTDHMSTRIICFSFGLYVSAVCISSNLIANKTYYEDDENVRILTSTSYWICIAGYCIISIVCVMIILLKSNYLQFKWKTKQKIGKWIGWIFLIGLLFIQIRRYSEYLEFTLIGWILSVDLQVMIQQ